MSDIATNPEAELVHVLHGNMEALTRDKAIYVLKLMVAARRVTPEVMQDAIDLANTLKWLP